MIAAHIRINLLFTEHTTIERWELLCAEEADVQLVEFRLYLGWLQVFLLLRVRIIFNLYLFVSRAADCDRNLQVGSNFTELLALGVCHYNPLVHKSVVFTTVNLSQIKLVVADEGILEESLVHQLDLNFTLLQALDLYVLRFKKDVLVPSRNARVVQIILSRGELALVEAVDFDYGVDSIALLNIHVLGLLHIDMDHIVAALHIADGLLLLLLGGFLLFLFLAFFLLFFFLRLVSASEHGDVFVCGTR